MRGSAGRPAILNWSKRVTQNYKYVNITDFNKSWTDGMALCAIINAHRPDLINYETLTPSDPLTNCKLAFGAMKTLGMIEYMDPEDLAGKAGVDEKCMLLQVSELHRYFSIPGNSTQTPSKTPSSSAPVTAAPVQPKLPPRRAEQEVPFSVPAGLLPPSQKATEAMKAIQNAMNPPKPAKAPMTPPIEMLKQLMEPCEMPDPEPGQKSLQFLIDDLVKNQLVIA